MSRVNKKSGFSIIEIIVVLAVVGVLGYLGYSFYNNQLKIADDSSQAAQQSATANDVPAAPEIKSTDDLTKAEKLLDETNLDNTSDNSQLDAELSAF